MKAAYVTTYDAADLKGYSGTGHFVARALEDAGIDLQYIGPLTTPRTLQTKARSAWNRHVRRRGYLRDRDPRTLAAWAQEVQRALADSDVDVIISPGTLPIAYLETDTPIVFWTDATFAGMIDFYPQFSNLEPGTLRSGNDAEAAAIARASIAIYSSDWAADTARAHYAVDEHRLHVVPYGANLAAVPDAATVEESIRNRSTDTCTLLFLGVEWERKGGDLVLELGRELNRRGIDTVVHLVGCAPPASEQPLPPWVHEHGFLSKRDAADTALLEQLLAESHFLAVPSRAECAGIVFCEASAYALPVLTRDVGGSATVVTNDVNGYLFPDTAPATDYVDTVARLMQNRAAYEQLARSSRAEYDRRLNWSVAGAAVRALIDDMLRLRRSA